MRPGRGDMTTRCVPRNKASSMEWVMKKIRLPVRSHTSTSNSCICSRVRLSSAPNGSSHAEDGGVGGERAGDANALAHAARQFIRGRIGKVLQADQSQQLLGAGKALFPTDARELE